MAASLFIISGLWAFKRIKKLTYGIAIYISCYVLYSIGTGYAALVKSGWDETTLLITGIFMLSALILSLLLPIILIRKWSIDWNKSNQYAILK